MAGHYLEDLSLGQSAERAHQISEADLAAFASASGDFNPLHMDEAFALSTPFKGRVAHGMLSASYISALIASELPGEGAIYLSQSLKFRRPVRIGDNVVTRVVITAIDQRRGHVTLKTTCSVGATMVLDGEAVVMASKRGV